MTYAKGTEVSVLKSRIEVETLLKKNGARKVFVSFDEDNGKAVIGFAVQDRLVRFELQMPPQPTPPRYGKTASVARWEQTCRERWRALVLALKSKFVSIETGVESFEQAFLAHTVMANRKTVHEYLMSLEHAKEGTLFLASGENAP